MRVAAWNVNNIGKRLPILLTWLDATKPDAVALQELKCSDAEIP
jgi:exodeoxyribonuclease-3